MPAPKEVKKTRFAILGWKYLYYCP